ncbi:MAG: glycosyltransferase family 1 protein [Candidatus Saccharimonadales bacterium]
MKIVLDTRIIETSTGRYMQRLLENINDTYALSDGNDYIALMPPQHVDKWQQRLTNITVMAADQKWYSFSEQWSLYKQLRGLKPDLVHFTMPQQPLLWVGPAVTTIHDMTLIRYDNIRPGESPIIYHMKQRVFRILLRIVLRRGDAIITPTEFVRQDLGTFFGTKYLDKIHVTPLAGEIPEVKPKPLKEFIGKKYLFFVGNAFPYKNIWRIIDAFRELQINNPELHLLLAGKKDEFYIQLEKRCIEENINNVHFLGFISDSEKRWALQNAQAFVTASLSEGFCMPVLEAMIEGCPVVASNVSCLPEVVGNAGLLFDPSSTKNLVSILEPLLLDDTLRQRLIKKGYIHARSYSWNRMVRQVHDIYLSLQK